MGTLPWYTTREEVKAAVNSADTTYNNRQVDRAIEDASRSVDDLCRRVFYPTLATRYFDWPTNLSPTTWRLWLDADEIISLTSLTSGGTTIASSDYFLEPVNDGPPYTHIEIDLDSSAVFKTGDTHQRNIAATGLFGYGNDTVAAGALEAAIATTATTTVDITDSSLIGVGSLLNIESERLIVTRRSMLDSGQNLGTSLTASAANTTVAVGDGTVFREDETILIESERMRIVDISGNNLIVKRAQDGSVLAAHASPQDIYVPRRLTVVRGVLGTTAATHADATAVTVQDYPGPVKALTVAEAINTIEQETSGYARVVGTGDSTRNASGRALEEKRKYVKRKYGRAPMHGAV